MEWKGRQIPASAESTTGWVPDAESQLIADQFSFQSAFKKQIPIPRNFQTRAFVEFRRKVTQILALLIQRTP